MIQITLASGSIHLVGLLDGKPDLEAYTTSPNTRAALQAAYDAGDWEPYEPPQAEPEPVPPDWPAFRLALMQSATFRDWSETLPTTWREDLKMAALVANLEALQTVYNVMRVNFPPTVKAAAEWAMLAQQHSIEMRF